MKYLFRGKLQGGDRWIYGYLKSVDEIIEDDILYKIDAVTASLWTNFKDDYGHKIFEKDVLEIDGLYYEVKYLGGSYVCECVGHPSVRIALAAFIYGNYKVKVIGNTYEAV